MSNQGYGYSVVSNGITLSTGASPAPVAAPDALVCSRAVQTKDGWLGQITVGGQIVWETDPVTDRDTAERMATRRILDKIARLFR